MKKFFQRLLSWALIPLGGFIACYVLLPWAATLYTLFCAWFAGAVPWLYSFIHGASVILDIGIYATVGLLVLKAVAKKCYFASFNLLIASGGKAEPCPSKETDLKGSVTMRFPGVVTRSRIFCFLFIAPALLILITVIFRQSSFFNMLVAPVYMLIAPALMPLNILGISNTEFAGVIAFQLIYDLVVYGLNSLLASRGKVIGPGFG